MYLGSVGAPQLALVANDWLYIGVAANNTLLHPNMVNLQIFPLCFLPRSIHAESMGLSQFLDDLMHEYEFQRLASYIRHNVNKSKPD